MKISLFNDFRALISEICSSKSFKIS